MKIFQFVITTLRNIIMPNLTQMYMVLWGELFYSILHVRL